MEEDEARRKSGLGASLSFFIILAGFTALYTVNLATYRGPRHPPRHRASTHYHIPVAQAPKQAIAP